MSTKSSYSSNKLNQVIENGTHHFVSKSYVSAKFDHDRKKSEYYLYWVNLKKGVFESDPKYHRMSCKPMNAKEKKYFKCFAKMSSLSLTLSLLPLVTSFRI